MSQKSKIQDFLKIEAEINSARIENKLKVVKRKDLPSKLSELAGNEVRPHWVNQMRRGQSIGDDCTQIIEVGLRSFSEESGAEVSIERVFD